MRANLSLIRQRLFDVAREKIARDYDFKEPLPATPEEFSERVTQSLDQRACEAPLDQKIGNDAIFRAAVRALGSNSRSWASYCRNETRIAETLRGFLVSEIRKNPPNCWELAKLLPGQTGRADACAILNWAHRLSEQENYYGVIRQASNEIQQRIEQKLPLHHLFLCMVAHFTDTSSSSRKWPGMGFVLGSEFLRNLRWNGLKPDRHIKRLLRRWTKDRIDQSDVQQTIDLLGRAVEKKSSPLIDNLRWSLIGMKIAPAELSYSQFDNLVWLLGAYVEKKNRESADNYIID